MGRCIIGAVLVVAMLVNGVALAAADLPADDEGPRHIIVLIDDSGDMNRHATAIAHLVPQALFAGLPQIPDLPRYRPGRDFLSLAYYGVRKDDKDGCWHGRPVGTIDPKALFAWDDPQAHADNRMTLESFLSERLVEGGNAKSRYNPCRFQGKWSPIALAEALVMGSVPLPPGLVRRVIIVNLTNFIGNTLPSNDAAFLSQQGYRDYDRVIAALDDMKATFHLVAGGGPRVAHLVGREINGGPYLNTGSDNNKLHIAVSEVRPVAPDPGMLVEVPRRLEIGRRAVSKEQLRLVGGEGRPAVLRLVPDARLKPSRITWRYRDNTPDALGQVPRQRSGEKLLAACGIDSGPPKPQLVPLLDLAGLSEVMPPASAPHHEAHLALSVKFCVVAENYGHLEVATPEFAVDLLPEPIQSVPSSGVFLEFVERSGPLDDRRLTAMWSADTDVAGLSQADAARLIDARRRQWDLPINLALAAIAVAIAISVYRRTPGRPFMPELRWYPTGDVVVDLDAPAGTLLLAGMVEVTNPAEPSPAARLLRKTDQPMVLGRLIFDDHPLHSVGFDINARGAVAGFAASGGSESLDVESAAQFGHGSRTPVFFDRRVVHDFLMPDPPQSDGCTIKVNCSVRLTWDKGGVALTLPIQMVVLPERPREPVMSFVNDDNEHVYRNDGSPQIAVPVGALRLISAAKLQFALPFVGSYGLRATLRGVRQPDDAFVLEREVVEVPAKGRVDVPVLARCDVLRNPEMGSDTYGLRPVGPHSAQSSVEPAEVRIHRDRGKSDLVIGVDVGRRRWEARFNDADGHVWVAELDRDGNSLAEPVPLADGVWVLDWCAALNFPRRRGAGMALREILTLTLVNPARNGKGVVRGTASHDLVTEKGNVQLRLRSGAKLNDLLFLDGLDRSGMVELPEGAKPARIKVQFKADSLDTIEGARIDSGIATAQISLRADVVTDDNHRFERHLRLVVPLTMEELPSPNWLAIDFGTSAITAALGDGTGKVDLIKLQDIAQPGGTTFADRDKFNSEQTNHHCLPSYVVCDADLRQRAAPTNDYLPGFPGSAKFSLRPGDAGFIGLPATTRDLGERDARVIFSLKSWLGAGVSRYRFDDPLRHLVDDGREVQSTDILLDDLMHSAMAAIVEGYLQPGGKVADKVALTHPNTFTPHHCGRFLRIARRVMKDKLKIPLDDRIQLVSESDAVAYHYAAGRLRDREPPSGVERVLVYDLGAGTLDISIVCITWSCDGGAPFIDKWEVLWRFGVPVAGNYLDELLARRIHAALIDMFRNHEAFEYRFPVVSHNLTFGKEHEHRQAVHELWRSIRAVKQGDGRDRGPWTGDEPFCVQFLDVGGASSIVGLVASASNLHDYAQQPPDDKEGFWYSETDGVLNVCIPATTIRDDGLIHGYLDFITGDVLDEALAGAGLGGDGIDTLLISGRGALWPGLMDRVHSKFPKAQPHDFRKEDNGQGGMKGVVVAGAIEWQLVAAKARSIPPLRRPRLAALLPETRTLIPEEQWNRPIPFGHNKTLRLVQITHRHPDPHRDLAQGSLRRHFYVRLTPYDFDRETFWAGEQEFELRVEDLDDGNVEIGLLNGQGGVASVNGENFQAVDNVTVPWPVGRVLLSPVSDE